MKPIPKQAGHAPPGESSSLVAVPPHIEQYIRVILSATCSSPWESLSVESSGQLGGATSNLPRMPSSTFQCAANEYVESGLRAISSLAISSAKSLN